MALARSSGLTAGSGLGSTRVPRQAALWRARDGWPRRLLALPRAAAGTTATASTAGDPPGRDARAGYAGRSGAGASAGPAANIREFEDFLRTHERPILNYLWRMTGDEPTAYDLTQEVFLRAWSHFDTIRGYDQPRAWLFRVATNLAISHARRRAVVPATVDLLDGARAPGGGDPASSDPAWRVAERDLVRQVLQQLAPKRRAALILREVYGLSAAETGRILKMSEAAVRMALCRARDQFADIYLREEGRDHER